MPVDIVNSQSATALFRPPGKFRQAKEVTYAELLTAPPKAFSSRGRTDAQRAGKRYEKHVLRYLEPHFPAFLPSPWIGFSDRSGDDRLCQPDALGFFSACVVIFEVKKIHTIDAWWQLRRLYEPVVSVLFPDFTPLVCEITGAFSPSTPWPEPCGLCWSLDDVRDLGSVFGVMQWRK